MLNGLPRRPVRAARAGMPWYRLAFEKVSKVGSCSMEHLAPLTIEQPNAAPSVRLIRLKCKTERSKSSRPFSRPFQKSRCPTRLHMTCFYHITVMNFGEESDKAGLRCFFFYVRIFFGGKSDGSSTFGSGVKPEGAETIEQSGNESWIRIPRMRVRSFPFPVSLLDGECSAILPLDSFALFGGIPADGSKMLPCLKES